MKKEVENFLEALDSLDDDSDNEKLEQTANYYCSLWDIREGYKHALRLTIEDQWQNHANEQNPKDIVTLKNKLKLFYPGDKVIFKNDNTERYIVHSIYSNGFISLGIQDFPDTEQDNQVHISELTIIKASNT